MLSSMRSFLETLMSTQHLDEKIYSKITKYFKYLNPNRSNGLSETTIFPEY
jgi:hypothetical protein